MNIQKEIIDPMNRDAVRALELADKFDERAFRQRTIAGINSSKASLQKDPARKARLKKRAAECNGYADKNKAKAQKARECAPGALDIVNAIAQALATELGGTQSVTGPSGIFCRYSIRLNFQEKDRTDLFITLQETFSKTEGYRFFCETTRRLQNFPEGSIGAINGGNIETVPLPHTSEEILQATIPVAKRN